MSSLSSSKPTNFTHKSLFFNVNSHVDIEVMFLCRFVVTLNAVIWFLFCVNSHVSSEMRFENKGCTTNFTNNRCMLSHVFAEIAFLSKSITTNFTNKWLFSSVNSYVSVEKRFPSKGLTANLANR